uniref:Macaca fascicularis brain cDNA, clone: QmoA-10367 n=1 Tax=Macaca fascicularis TaxID=9541 RepID=I7GJ11_MACFA|nr:unnamed protein product [Macaca fascicularis]
MHFCNQMLLFKLWGFCYSQDTHEDLGVKETAEYLLNYSIVQLA